MCTIFTLVFQELNDLSWQAANKLFAPHHYSKGFHLTAIFCIFTLSLVAHSQFIKMSLKNVLSILFLSSTLLMSGQVVIEATTVSEKNLVKKFFCDELIYPEASQKAGHEGTVKLKFAVNTEGAAENIRVVQSVDPRLDAEAVRVFRMLLWRPATRYGEPIVHEQEYSIKFSIRKYEKHCKTRGYNELTYPYLPVDTSYFVFNLEETDQTPFPVFTEPGMNLSSFLINNMEYPSEAYKQGITGTSSIGFVVETHGHISNITIVQGLGGGCNEEAIRLIKMLKWMPGVKDGMAIRVSLQLHLTFSLDNDPTHQLFSNDQINSM